MIRTPKEMVDSGTKVRSVHRIELHVDLDTGNTPVFRVESARTGIRDKIVEFLLFLIHFEKVGLTLLGIRQHICDLIHRVDQITVIP